MARPDFDRHHFFGRNFDGPAPARAGDMRQIPAVKRRFAALPGNRICHSATSAGDAWHRDGNNDAPSPNGSLTNRLQPKSGKIQHIAGGRILRI